MLGGVSPNHSKEVGFPFSAFQTRKLRPRETEGANQGHKVVIKVLITPSNWPFCHKHACLVSSTSCFHLKSHCMCVEILLPVTAERE